MNDLGPLMTIVDGDRRLKLSEIFPRGLRITTDLSAVALVKSDISDELRAQLDEADGLVDSTDGSDVRFRFFRFFAFFLRRHPC